MENKLQIAEFLQLEKRGQARFANGVHVSPVVFEGDDRRCLLNEVQRAMENAAVKTFRVNFQQFERRRVRLGGHEIIQGREFDGTGGGIRSGFQSEIPAGLLNIRGNNARLLTQKKLVGRRVAKLGDVSLQISERELIPLDAQQRNVRRRLDDAGRIPDVRTDVNGGEIGVFAAHQRRLATQLAHQFWRIA